MHYSDQSLIKSIIRSQRGEISVERYTHEVYLEVITDPMIRKRIPTRYVRIVQPVV